MKTAALLLLALTLCACRQEDIPTRSGEIDLQRLADWSQDMTGPDVFAAWLAAIGTQTNRAELLTAYAGAADEAIVKYLTSQPRGSLIAKLDSLARRTNRHHYTKEQLERAIEAKDRTAQDRRRPSE